MGFFFFLNETDFSQGLVIAISSAKFEPRNFWTGSWRAVWKASFAAGAKVASILKCCVCCLLLIEVFFFLARGPTCRWWEQ